MIKTTDLMLGNWVEYATGINNDKRSIPMQVMGIFADNIYLDFDGNEGDVLYEADENLLGIPITEEVLGRIMRRYNVLHGHGFANGNVVIEFDNGVALMRLQYDNGEVHGIRYLHQLQNAYFMLTGKRLEVKL